MSYYVYLARCCDGSLYTGSCHDVNAREKKHNAGEGAQYTKLRRPVKIIYTENYLELTEARRREAQIKRWSRIKKENLVKYGRTKK